jgi:hypothetical protein
MGEETSDQDHREDQDRARLDLIRFYDDYDSGYGSLEHDPELEDIPREGELPALQAWEEQNAAKLAKMSKRKKATARFDALKEIRVQRAREQIEAASPDEAREPESGSDQAT